MLSSGGLSVTALTVIVVPHLPKSSLPEAQQPATTAGTVVNRPGFVGDSILWKRGWSHGQKQQTRAAVFA